MCSIPECDIPVSRKGWCYAHYRRWRRYGDPTGGGPPRREFTSDADRFWDKVDKSAGPEACWPWTGSRTPQGYGKFSWRAIRLSPLIAPRVAYFLENGAWPGETLHLCDNPPCVNPLHLRDGSHQENQQQAVAAGRWTGEQNAGAKLTRDQVREIRTLLADGRLTQAEIARRYHVTPSHVNHIKAGRTRRQA